MLSGKQIKVIKHGKGNDSQAVDLDRTRTSVSNRLERKRDAINIVTGWVSELRRKKAQETASGFQSLFSKVGL